MPMTPIWKAVKNSRSNFLLVNAERRQSLQDFLNAIAPNATPVKRVIITLVRAMLADNCGVPPDYIRADAELSELRKLLGGISFIEAMFRSCDFDVFAFFPELERRLAQEFGLHLKVSARAFGISQDCWLAPEKSEYQRLGSWLSWLSGELIDISAAHA